MDNFDKNIGQRIWNLRSLRGLTREELSEKADISSKFLYEIENGKKGMSANVLYRLAESLETDCNHLIYGDLESKNFSYIMRLLSSLNNNQIKHVEKILFHFCEACKYKI